MNQQEKTPFFTALLEYSKSNVTPFDVPGHKLGNVNNDLIASGGELIYKLDANAPRGLDNLNHPSGVIKEAEALCAAAFLADKAYFLVNGTTSSIQAMILSVIKDNEYILLPRNSHKSVINALILSGGNPIFIEPKFDKAFGFARNVDFETVKEAIDNNPMAKAIFLIHPTYFGEVADLERIVEYAHDKDLLVLIDEAHGTHFSFSNDLPKSAIACKADMVATSMHKTGLSLTQTSVLLTTGNRVSDTNIRTAINILQSTSPSSILIASLDIARKELYFNANKLIKNILIKAQSIREKIKKLKNIEVLDEEYFMKQETFAFDNSKLIISFRKLGISGLEAYKLLKDEYNIQAELGEKYVTLFVITAGTTEQDLDNLYFALKNIDERYEPFKKESVKVEYTFPKAMIKPRDAYNSEKIDLPIEEALGFISAESIMIYPPGIPLIIPGEQIDQNIIDSISDYLSNGCILFKDSPEGLIRVVKI